MANPLSTLKGKLLLLAALLFIAVVLVVWLVLGEKLLALTIFAIGIVLILLWFGINWAFAAWTHSKQESFDVGVAAREGIADRKREWAGWTAELKKQGIDRYKLPMYLLVGEPQSGKSILFQNSDLHFPFGQSRLSGIGGTKGCDWWFTDEAVILDLAGRLFTHEGGKSDEAEWAAFLTLLTNYRPQCPANGVLLVLPCDALVQDSPETSAAKANKMQAALLTLTSQLQARLPVYVVLTKGDKVFGFAETFHRLDAQKRAEMLGWSRPANAVEIPYNPEEARAAFAALVERMRFVRAEMMSTEVLPEGLTAVDRMYAFPSELAALYANLAIYLQRIFGESALVDGLFFRGFYLTSGLQSGAPIAKVCSEILGQKGQADARALESIFTKSRAYFIKDLIRKRIFPESGLVQPTRNRILRARRNAILGYGLATVVVLFSLYFAISYYVDDYSQSNGPMFDKATESARAAATAPGGLGALVQELSDVEAPTLKAERTVEDSIYNPIRGSFKELHDVVWDKRVAPELHRVAQEGWLDDSTFEKRIDSIRKLANNKVLGDSYPEDEKGVPNSNASAPEDVPTVVIDYSSRYSDNRALIQSTVQVVTDLGHLRERRTQAAPSTGLRGAPARFYTDLCLSLESALRMELLRSLRTEYKQQIENEKETGPVIRELFAESLAHLNSIQQERSGMPVNVSAVNKLFGKGGALDSLLKDYRSASDTLFVWGDKEGSSDLLNFGHKIQFLDDLRSYLLNGGEQTDLSQVTISIKFQPLTSESGTLWNGPGSRTYFYYPSDSVGGTRETLNNGAATFTLDWRFPTNAMMLRMVWSDFTGITDWSVAANRLTKDSFLEVKSPFAPMLLAWWGGGKPDQGWSSVRLQPEHSQLSAPMKVLFPLSSNKKTLPMRP